MNSESNNIYKVRIIHLSDFHYKKEFDNDFNTIMHTISEKIKERINQWEGTNIIILSGDLAYSGTEEEYKKVGEKLEDLRKDTNSIGIFSSPGNHDIDRKKYPANYILDVDQCISHGDWDGLKKLEENILLNFNIEHPEPYIEPYIEPYVKFSRSLEENNKVKVDYNGLTGVAKLLTEDKKCYMNIILLNSAWLLSPSYTYFGYVGENQIKAALKLMENGVNDSCFNVTVLHHPFQALAPASQYYFQELMDISNIILTGHIHRWQSFVSLSSDSENYNENYQLKRFPGKCIMIGARCTREEHKGERFLPGFNIMELEININNQSYSSDLFKYVWVNNENVRVEERDPFININSSNEKLSITSSFTKLFERDEIELIKNAKDHIRFFTNVVRGYNDHKELIRTLLDARKEHNNIDISYWTYLHNDEDYIGALIRKAIGCKIYFIPDEEFSDISKCLGGNGVRVIIGDNNNLIRGFANDRLRGRTDFLSHLENDKIGVRGYLDFWKDRLESNKAAWEQAALEKMKEHFLLNRSNAEDGRLVLNPLINDEKVQIDDEFCKDILNYEK